MTIEPQMEATAIDRLDPNISDTRMVAGWISPEGKYFKVPGIWAHDVLARSIIGRDDAGGHELELAGWVHLTNRGSPCILRGTPYTQAQLDTLFDLGLKFEGREFGRAILAAIRTVQEQ